MSLYINGQKYNVTMAKWRGFWSIKVFGLPGTEIECGTTKVIGDEGYVIFRLAEEGKQVFVANLSGSGYMVKEITLTDDSYYMEVDMFVGMKYIEYIEEQEGDGRQCIDTGVIGNNINLKIDVTFMIQKSPPTDWAGIFSNYNDSENDEVTRVILNERNISQFLVYLNSRAGGGGTRISSSASKHHLIYDKYTITLDGTTISQNRYTGNEINTTIWLFSGSARVPTQVPRDAGRRFYNMKIYDNGVLIRDFNPILIGEEAAMFDNVNHKIYHNLGPGAFVPGPDIEVEDEE